MIVAVRSHERGALIETNTQPLKWTMQDQAGRLNAGRFAAIDRKHKLEVTSQFCNNFHRTIQRKGQFIPGNGERAIDTRDEMQMALLQIQRKPIHIAALSKNDTIAARLHSGAD